MALAWSEIYSESAGDGRGARIVNAEGKKSHPKEYAQSRAMKPLKIKQGMVRV